MKRLLFKSGAFIFLFFVLNSFIGVFLEKPKDIQIAKKKYDSYWRWKEFYDQPERSLDLVFLGSSHSFESFDPRIFDEVLGIKSFNMGSPSQSPVTSYFVLREVLETQKPKVIVYEVYWNSFLSDDSSADAGHNIDYMRSFKNRRDMFMEAFTAQGMLNHILSSLRYRGNFRDAVLNLFGQDITSQKDFTYESKGYVSSQGVVSKGFLYNGNPFKDYVFDRKMVKTKQVNYLERIIQLCRSKGIIVMFVTSPLPPASLGMMKNYAHIHGFFNEIAQSHQIEYLDYNVMHNDKDLFTDHDFKDCDHLNVKGVLKLDKDLALKLEKRGLFRDP